MTGWQSAFRDFHNIHALEQYLMKGLIKSHEQLQQWQPSYARTNTRIQKIAFIRVLQTINCYKYSFSFEISYYFINFKYLVKPDEMPNVYHDKEQFDSPLVCSNFCTDRASREKSTRVYPDFAVWISSWRPTTEILIITMLLPKTKALN